MWEWGQALHGQDVDGEGHCGDWAELMWEWVGMSNLPPKPVQNTPCVLRVVRIDPLHFLADVVQGD